MSKISLYGSEPYSIYANDAIFGRDLYHDTER